MARWHAAHAIAARGGRGATTGHPHQDPEIHFDLETRGWRLPLLAALCCVVVLELVWVLVTR